jgi:uncharacterized protein (TIGR02453 family)
MSVLAQKRLSSSSTAQPAGLERPTFSGFSPAALDFLRKLARNNRREWFKPRKHIYDSEIHAPMLQLIAAINAELVKFAPRYVITPAKAMLRIYRDTRFSTNKTPYKKHVSALFPRAGASRTSGACFYFHFTDKELLIFAGVWNPPADELRAIRGFLAEHHAELERMLRAKAVRELYGEMQGEQLTRVPAGFSKEHAAAKLLRGKQWYVERTLPAQILLGAGAVTEIVRHFRAAAPFVEFMNQPLLARKPARPDILQFSF